MQSCGAAATPVFLVFLCGTCILLASEIERKIGLNKFEMYKVYGEV
jgi:hypothetical protein